MEPVDRSPDIPPIPARPSTPASSPVYSAVVESSFFHAACASIAAAPVVAVISYLAQQGPDTAFSGWLIVNLFIFLLVLYRHLLHIFRNIFQSRQEVSRLRWQTAVEQAQLEQQLGQDLNQSGEIGDVVIEPTAAEFARHLSEFNEQIRNGVRTQARNDWLAHPGSDGRTVEGYQFRDGARITRSEYEQIIQVLKDFSAITGRKKGKSGELTSSLLPSDVA